MGFIITDVRGWSAGQRKARDLERSATPIRAGATLNDRGDGMGDEVNELAALFAAWRYDIDSVPVSIMPLLETALLLHTGPPNPPAARSYQAVSSGSMPGRGALRRPSGCLSLRDGG